MQSSKAIAEANFAEEQRKNPVVAELITFRETEQLLQDNKQTKRNALQESLFVLNGGVLDPEQEHRPRIAASTHL